MLRLAAGIALIVLCTGTSYAACNVTPFRFFFGSPSSTAMLVSSGGSCRIAIRANHNTVFESTTVTVRPRNGTAFPSGSGGVTYRPRPGYRGSDTFVFAVTGRSRVPATITVSVTVQ